MLNIPHRPQKTEKPDCLEALSKNPESPPQESTSPGKQRGKKQKPIFQRLSEWIQQTTRILLLVNGLAIVIFLTWVGVNLIFQIVEFLSRTLFGGSW